MEAFEDSIRYEKDKYYNSIEDIFKDMTGVLGLPWVFFIKLYENAFETYKINIYEEIGAIRLLKKMNPEYYETVLRFEKEVRETFKITDRSPGIIPPELYNKLISLSLVMVKVAEFITSEKCKKELKSFSDSIMFLGKAKKSSNPVPMEFYTNLSVIFMMEDLRIKYEVRKKSKRTKTIKKDLKIKMDILRNFFLKKFVEIVNITYTEGDKRPIIIDTIKINRGDVFYHIKNDKPKNTYPLEFFDKDGRAMTIILTGDKRTGKTIGWLKILESALSMKYTVIIFGKDTRLELRWGCFPISREESTANLYDALVDQNQKPRGLPITIYKHNPEYPIEREIENFDGTPEQWNRMKGVVTFEDDLLRVMKSFERWRSKDKTKNIISMFNEMHTFIPSIPKKREWVFVQYVKDLFTNIGGYRCPVIGTTQYLHKIDANARQIDTIISSYMTNIKDRKAVAQIVGDKRIEVWVGDLRLKEKHHFLMFKGGRIERIRFLVPSCMPESSTEKTLDELFEEASQNIEKEEKNGPITLPS